MLLPLLSPPPGPCPLGCVLPQNAFSSRNRMDCGAEGCEATLRPSILLTSVVFGAATEPGALRAALSSPACGATTPVPAAGALPWTPYHGPRAHLRTVRPPYPFLLVPGQVCPPALPWAPHNFWVSSPVP